MAKAKVAKKTTRATKTAPKAKSTARATKSRKQVAEDLDGDHQHEPGSTSLVIVESPAKAKTIGKYLGRAYRVRATIGHVRDLPEKKIGIDIDNGFQPEYVTIPGKEKTVAELKSAARDSREIFLATDPDREGEAIAWHVAQQIKSKNGAPVRRVLFHEITRDAVQSAIQNAGDIDERKVDAQQARRVLDRLVGYKASPVLWKTVKKGISAGRVQTVALRLLVEREREIRAFKAVEYWTVEALLEEKGQQFTAKLHLLDGKKPVISNEKEANAILAALKSRKTFQVTEIKRRERRKNPGAPFTTSTLQQDAAKKLGFGSKRTMRLAQDLYEGIDVGEDGPTGLITYMRTDSTRVAASAADQARDYIKMMFGQEYLPDAPRLYMDGKSKNAQDAHEAIRPTDPTRRPEHIRKHLKEDQYKLYELIWQRFMASQMSPAIFDTTTIDFDFDRFLFRATGSVVKFDGYQKLYKESREAEEGKPLEAEQG
ncbi:MAG TPA: type I DNA topoisomerase, partial [Gemmatimonadaceae bacterium]